MKSSKKLVSVTVWLHPGVWERLRNVSKARGKSVTDVFSDAVERALNSLEIEVEAEQEQTR